MQKCRRLADFDASYRSQKSVRSLAEEFLKPYNDGTYTPASGITVQEFAEQFYLPYVKQNKRPSTYDGYRKMWASHLNGKMDIALRDFRTFDCELLLTAVTRERNFGIRTVAHLKNFLSGIFRYAIRIGALNRSNPIRDACLPKANAPKDTAAYTLPEIAQMIRVLTQPAKTIVAVAAFTGLRRGELRGLTAADYRDGTLIVRRSVWKRHIGEPKGKRGTGAVPVIPTLASILDKYIRDGKPGNFMFETQRGRPADLDYIARNVIVPTLANAGLAWHGWHAFRRGLATNLHTLGVSDIVIQAILRHSDVAVTRAT
jgi:integrase